MAEMDPVDRARQAVESLSAEGLPVTARAVRERANVRMTVAAEAARLHAEEAAAAAEIPEMPAPVVARVDALWRAAVVSAREEMAVEREGWAAKLDQAAREDQELRAEIEHLEDLVGQSREELAKVTQEAREARQAAEARVTEQRSRADRAEAVAEAVREERDRVIAERDDLRARLDTAARKASE